MNLNKITDLKFAGIDHSDYPKYCDAYIWDGLYFGEHLDQEQIDEINEDREYIYEQLINYLY